MSPRDATPQNSGYSQLSFGSSLTRKSSLRGSISKERLVRGSSPLTPWEDNSSKKRKPSLKGSTRQTKIKLTVKDNKKKNKKDETKSRNNDSKSKCANSCFLYHADIHQYMAEYKRNRKSSLKEENSNYEEYGPNEISKVYESLGIPRLSRLSRLSNVSRKNFLPPVQDIETENENLGAENDDSTSDSDSDDISDDDIEVPSPEARERKNNLNLSPLRKQVRLPDMNNFPVQTVSGINLLELARITTARADSTDSKHKFEKTTSYSRSRFSSPEKKLLNTALNLREKVMCRVVDLSLPNSYELQLQKSIKSSEEITDKTSQDVELPSENLELKKEVFDIKVKKEACTIEKIKKLNLGDPQDDTLTIAIGTSRSCQSSVLSHAVSPNSSAFSNQSQTVKELLTATVKDLNPFNHIHQFRDNEKSDGASKILNFRQNASHSSDPKTKPLASLKTYRKFRRKRSVKKFIEDSPSQANEKKEGKDACLIEGKMLRKHKDHSSSLPVLDDDFKKSFKHAAQDLTKMPKVSPQTDSAKLRKRAQERKEAAEKYEQFKRAMALDNQTQHIAKLAILSKCQTVVKPQVSLKL